MTDLQAILQAFPAGTKLVVIAAELPDRSHSVPVVLRADGAANSAAGPGGDGTAAPAPGGEADHLADGHHDMAGADVHDLHVEHVRRLHHTRGNVALKPREWSTIVGLSARELRRAIEANAVPHVEKADGRDHGAKLITAEAILGYLTTVLAVERDHMPAPTWWPSVRGRRAASADVGAEP
jgi:hypothetical protein